MKTLNMADHKNRPCELYFSTSPKLTAEYFLDDMDAISRFAVLAFEYECGKHKYYVRYPDFPHFIEMYDSGTSSHGTMEHAGLRNVIGEQVNPFIYQGVLQEDTLEIFKHECSGLINFKLNQFNFLTRVAQQGKRNKTEPDFGKEYLERAFNRKYIPLPDLRNIEYAFKTEEGHLVIANSSAFNYSYEDIIVQYGTPEHGFMTAKVKDFQRYRDGGTTKFIANIMGIDHKFYSPTCFNPELVATWNDKPMTKLNETEIAAIAKLLNINVAPKTGK